MPTTIDEIVGEESLRELVDRARRTIVVSEFAGRALVRRYGIASEKLTVLPVGWPAHPVTSGTQRAAARAEVRRRYGLSDDAFLVVGCGAVHPRKGPDLFVQAAREAAKRAGAEGLRFLWVGGPQSSEAYLEWCRNDVAAAGLAGRVEFVGEVDDAAPFYDAADAFVLPSREDPFPLVVLEAMARGLPVVAFEGAGGAPEALAGGAGVTVPYLDTTEMACALVRLAGAPRHRDELARRAAFLHGERYDWSRFVARLFELLHADFALARPPAPAAVETPIHAARA
jgi:glycosyltransferase involved in cell wall biosynthesis